MTTLPFGSRSYLVEKTADAYILHGARGAKYQLCRCRPNPSMLFAVSLTATKGPVSNTPFHKNRVRFTDADGELRIIRR